MYNTDPRVLNLCKAIFVSEELSDSAGWPKSTDEVNIRKSRIRLSIVDSFLDLNFCDVNIVFFKINQCKNFSEVI